jgi:hypothetical protein
MGWGVRAVVVRTSCSLVCVRLMQRLRALWTFADEREVMNRWIIADGNEAGDIDEETKRVREVAEINGIERQNLRR